MRARLPLLALAFLILLPVIAACGDDDNGGGKSGTLIIARQTDLSTLDPVRSFCDTCQIYLSATYQTLVTLKDGSLTDAVGVLAEKWEVADDLKTYTFHLNPKAKFADGKPVTSADVVFSLKRLKNVKSGPSFFMDGVSAFETPDAATVVFKLENPDSAFLYKLMAPYCVITQASVVQQNGGTDADDAADTDKAQEFFDAHSAGSGAYMLESWTRNTELRLAKNPNYWGPLNPTVPTIVIKEVKDASAQRQQLEQGDVDIAMNISQDVANQIDGKGGVSAKFSRSYNFLYLEANESADPRLTKEVRQAIALALDYEGITKATVGGHGIQPATTIPQGFLGTDLAKLTKQDVAKAKDLLSKGGQPNGFNIKLGYPNQALYGVDMGILAQKVAADLGAIGIKVDLEPLEIAVWGQSMTGGELPLTLGYWAPDYPDSSEYVAWFGLMGVPGTPSAWLGDVTDPRIIDAAGKALATADAKKRADIYKDIIGFMQEDSYDIALVQPDLVIANRDNIENNAYSPCCNLVLGKLAKK